MLNYDVDFKYDANLNIDCPYPIRMGDGFVGVGEFVTTAPLMPSYTTIRGRRVWQAPEDTIEQFDVGNAQYGHPRSNKKLCALLGPRFPKRWMQANVQVFERPLVKLMGPTRFRQVCMFWAGGRMWHNITMWQWVWENRNSLEQVVRDGYTHMIPLIKNLNVDPADQPLRALRERFGKGGWKELCAVHPSKMIHLSYLAASRMPAIKERAQFVTLYARIPRTLFPVMDGFSFEELALLARLAQQRPVPYKRVTEYARYCDQYNYIRRFGREAGVAARPEMTVQQIERAHERVLAVHEAQYQERLAKLSVDDTKEFELHRMVPYDLQAIDSRLVARLLRTKQQYRQQGSDQQHCVGSYGVDGLSEQCYTYSIERDGHVVSTVMFEVDGRVKQHYGKYNGQVVDRGALDLVEQLQYAIQTCDVM